MAGTVIEYLQKYGDISFREKPLNDVDSLALCQLSYLKFDGMVSDVRHNGPSVTLREIAERPDVDKLFGDVRFEKENRALFEGMLSDRLCYISNHTKRTDHFWYLLWYFHRTVPLLRSQCRRSFLCNYLKQPLSSYDREIHSTKRFWCCENKT